MKAKKKDYRQYRLIHGESQKAITIKQTKRHVKRAVPAKMIIAPQTLVRALKATAGSKEIIKLMPTIAKWQNWFPTATFSVCQKTGTATYLDIWDADHFDGFTDMQRSIMDCRVWFSADGYKFWDSSETKTGRINCYFKAPSTGNYVCNVQLQSYGGLAQVECLIDSFSYGPLTVNGSINQPHTASLDAGYHSFRIRQMAGSFFFLSLTVWKI